jgi:type II secretory pathway pseudopilin PulG
MLLQLADYNRRAAMFKRLNNKKGATLTELIVGMLVLSIILLAVTSVFLPLYNAHVYANDMAEINALLNSLSAVIISDIERATGGITLTGGTLTIPVRADEDIIYDTNYPPGDSERQFLQRRIRRGASPGTWAPVFDPGFYRRMDVTIGNSAAVLPGDGLFSFVLVISDRTGEVERREYTARPIAWQ